MYLFWMVGYSTYMLRGLDECLGTMWCPGLSQSSLHAKQMPSNPTILLRPTEDFLNMKAIGKKTQKNKLRNLIPKNM